ncbi:MAG: hypothetical protein HGA75_06245 [Thiobacillus sp.]|nr:hypothetical protein [Thiobacillus sp.]
MNSISTRLLPAVLAGLLVSPTVSAESYGFKGINLGSNISQLANTLKYDCRSVKTPTADQVCTPRPGAAETIAGAPVDTIFYFYAQSLLTGISVYFPEKHFTDVVASLSSKYGVSVIEKETVRNLNGKSFENQIHTWHQGAESMVAQRYSGRLDKSSVRISDDAAAQRVKERRERIKREPGSDL